ncbi:Hypothetical predicted protein, partial [Olea europaea subsp. europaea]
LYLFFDLEDFVNFSAFASFCRSRFYFFNCGREVLTDIRFESGNWWKKFLHILGKNSILHFCNHREDIFFAELVDDVRHELTLPRLEKDELMSTKPVPKIAELLLVDPIWAAFCSKAVAGMEAGRFVSG